ncbi:unnamed protein product [Owenia fusiformis]|uniref:Uncharacterized protein n=1 Tax=Owenia fusiformis TaxID=6347 RepID=A0A8S4PM18_OWEFU|nr:unnamed protein product [Owenia fusiformis]
MATTRVKPAVDYAKLNSVGKEQSSDEQPTEKGAHSDQTIQPNLPPPLAENLDEQIARKRLEVEKKKRQILQNLEAESIKIDNIVQSSYKTNDSNDETEEEPESIDLRKARRQEIAPGLQNKNRTKEPAEPRTTPNKNNVSEQLNIHTLRGMQRLQDEVNQKLAQIAPGFQNRPITTKTNKTNKTKQKKEKKIPKDKDIKHKTKKDQIKELKKQANRNMMSAYNSKTWQNLYTQWRTFLLFCVYYNMAFLPVQTDTVLIYMQFLSRTFKSVSSILNYVNGIKVLHLLHELPFPLLHREFQYKLLYKGLQRNNLHTVKRALPITPEILTQIFGSLDLTSDLESTFWFLILTLTFLFARAGNIIPYTTSTFENNKHLLQQDIFKQDSDGLIFLIKHSKTNQAAQRILTLPVLAKESSPLNIVSAFNHKNSFHKYKKTSPAFLYSKNGKLITFTRQKIR